ncbi:MAG: hypothetical protein HS132_14430 [Planctomycetia bacterium]|nr:hypothetical protein [Planctomycetia bacterium]
MARRRNMHTVLMLTIISITILGSGCAMFKKRPLLTPRESGDTLVEITDPKQLPDFKDDYSRDALLTSIDNSLAYYKRVKANPYGFRMTGFSHENLENTLRFFREVSSGAVAPRNLMNLLLQTSGSFRLLEKNMKARCILPVTERPSTTEVLHRQGSFVTPCIKCHPTLKSRITRGAKLRSATS